MKVHGEEITQVQQDAMMSVMMAGRFRASDGVDAARHAGVQEDMRAADRMIQKARRQGLIEPLSQFPYWQPKKP